jgi:cobalt-zinc-cadmium efflux system membrane fusion protein
MYSRLFIFSFSGIFWLSGCRVSLVREAEAGEAGVVVLSEQQRIGAGVRVSPLSYRSLRVEKKLWGRTVVLAHSQASLHTPMEGVVREILIQEGQKVSRGEVCFWIYAPAAIELQRQYGEAYQQKQALVVRLAQQESLAAQRFLSLSEIEQSRRQLRQIDQQLYALERQLMYVGIIPDTLGRIGLLPVRAPLSGYVSRVSAVMGQYMRMETELARLVSTADLHADFYLTEGDLGWVRTGMPLWVRLPALPEAGEIATRIEYIAQVEDSTGPHLIAHTGLRNLPYAIGAGIPVEGRTYIQQESLLVVSKGAVVYHGRQPYVFWAESDSVFRPIPVQATFVDTMAIIRGEQVRLSLPVVTQGAAFIAAQAWTMGEE